MTPQVLVRYLEKYYSMTPRKVYSMSSIGQIPRKVYSMTPQVLVRYLEIVYSMTPQVLVRYLEKYIQ